MVVPIKKELVCRVCNKDFVDSCKLVSTGRISVTGTKNHQIIPRMFCSCVDGLSLGDAPEKRSQNGGSCEKEHHGHCRCATDQSM